MQPELLDENFLDFEWINVPKVKFSDLTISADTKILILLKSSDVTDNAKILLSKILQSIGIDLVNQATLVPLNEGEHINMGQLNHEKESLLCLVMGLSAEQLCLQIQHKLNESFTLGKNKYLFTFDLTSLENNIEYKKALWAALKTL